MGTVPCLPRRGPTGPGNTHLTGVRDLDQRPDITTILPHLILPAVLALVVLLWARRRGATWTQVQLSFGAGMLGAFMTASGWVFAAYMSGEQLSTFKVLGSQLLVGAACGLMVFFGVMPHERDVTDEARVNPDERQ